jgi:hypothetical protein
MSCSTLKTRTNKLENSISILQKTIFEKTLDIERTSDTIEAKSTI